MVIAVAIMGVNVLMAASKADAQSSSLPILDHVNFGDSASEAAHAVDAPSSEVIAGGLGQPARRLLPLSPVSYKGGALTFNVKVDPEKLNYVTFKFWGSDKGEDSGRLLLFCGDTEIGYRDQGDYDIVNQIENTPIYPGRFLYTTLPLPPSLTNGKTSLTLTLEPIGSIWPYGSSFAKKQKSFITASRGIYAAYSSTDACVTLPASEPQGTARAVTVRPGPGIQIMATARDRVNSMALKLSKTGSKPKDAGPISFLATAYETPWSSVYHNKQTLQRIVELGDTYIVPQGHGGDEFAASWEGSGPLGCALMRIFPALQASGALEQTVVKPDGTAVPRRVAWADALYASATYWAGHRRSYTNQSMIVDTYIYTANEGLRLLDPSRALPKDTVLGFLYQSIGLLPWTGSETTERSGGGMDLPAGAYSQAPYGKTYFDMTSKGLSRELGYVAGYGETILHFGADMIRLTGDPKIKAQVVKMAHARAPFRYPLPDADGFRAMFLEAITDTRNGHYPADVAYGAHHGSRESEPMELAVLTGDPAIIGMAEQELADNQYFAYINSHLNTPDPGQIEGLLNAVNDYEAMAKLPKSSYRLPMTDGQPDFVWTDEDDAVVAIKHGDRRMYFNFYYRAERAINGVVRIHDMTPTVERIVTARSQYEYTPSGHEYVRSDWVDSMRGVGFPPPGETIHQAWAGEKMPIQKRPDDAAVPAYGDWGPFLGRADFYSLVYGDYVIGLNTNTTKSYTLNVPTGVTAATDLATGKNVSLGGSITVAPKSTVVLYLKK